MRIKKLKTIFTLGLVTLATLLACRKEEQPEMNAAEDPCECASEVSADFDILERHGLGASNSPLILTDHVFGGVSADVYFRAKEDEADYTWYIGTDIETDQETFKTFGSQWIGSTIPITLVVKKEPNLICFPNDDGYDSITKSFNIYDICHEPYLLEGTFRMAPENSIDSFDIIIEFKEYPPSNNCYTADITNFDRQGSTCPGNYFEVSKSYRYMQAQGGTNFEGPCQSLSPFRAWHHMDGLIRMEYEYYENNDVNKETIVSLLGRKL